jgi:putative exporter of polyketide antibiotics
VRELRVSTIYDAVTIGAFAFLAILYLQRSSATEPRDRIVHYVPPALGCALANWLGNNHQELLAVIVIAAVVAYTLLVLKPFSPAK